MYKRLNYNNQNVKLQNFGYIIKYIYISVNNLLTKNLNKITGSKTSDKNHGVVIGRA